MPASSCLPAPLQSAQSASTHVVHKQMLGLLQACLMHTQEQLLLGQTASSKSRLADLHRAGFIREMCVGGWQP